MSSRGEYVRSSAPNNGGLFGYIQRLSTNSSPRRAPSEPRAAGPSSRLIEARASRQRAATSASRGSTSNV
jgi:hypothetical protein